MTHTYLIAEVTDDYTYAVFTANDGSGSFGKMFHGLKCADKAELDATMSRFLGEYVAGATLEQERAQKNFDAKAIIRQAQPIDVTADSVDAITDGKPSP